MNSDSYLYEAPFGYLCLTRGDTGAISIDFVAPETRCVTVAPPSVFWRPYVTALAAYFEDAGTPFPFALVVKGTEFQQKVWAQIAAIPVGETRSYQDLAIALDSPRAPSARPVGEIPCRCGCLAIGWCLKMVAWAVLASAKKSGYWGLSAGYYSMRV